MGRSFTYAPLTYRLPIGLACVSC